MASGKNDFLCTLRDIFIVSVNFLFNCKTHKELCFNGKENRMAHNDEKFPGKK